MNYRNKIDNWHTNIYTHAPCCIFGLVSRILCHNCACEALQVRETNPNVRVLFLQLVLPVHHGYEGLPQLHCRGDNRVRFLHRNRFKCITSTRTAHTVICIKSYHTAFKCRNNSIPHPALAVLMLDFCYVAKMNCFDKIRFNFLFPLPADRSYTEGDLSDSQSAALLLLQ